MTFDLWLESHDQRRTVLLEVEYLKDGQKAVLYFSSRPFVSFPNDTPANMPYDDVILDGLEYTRQVPNVAASELRSYSSSVTLAATDEVVAASAYEFAGQVVRVYLGDERWRRDDFQLIGVLKAESLEPVSKGRYRLNLKTTVADLLKVIETGKINEGSNPEGSRPLTLGSCRRIRAVSISDDGLKYLLSDRALASVSNIRVGDAEPDSPPQIDLANGTLTFSSEARGLVTADIVTAEPATLKSLITSLLNSLGITAIEPNTLDQLPGDIVGLYSAWPITYKQVFDNLLGSLGFYYGFNRFGAFTVGRLGLPNSSPSFILTPDDIALEGVKFERRLQAVKEVKLSYNVPFTRNGNEEAQTASAVNPGLELLYPEAETLEVSTYLTKEADAQAEALRRAALRDKPLRVFSFNCFAVPFGFNLGDDVLISYPYLGFNQGKPGKIIKISDVPLKGRVNIEVLINE